MAEAGVERLAGLDRLAVLGLAEVVRHLPDLLRVRRAVYERIAAEDVDLVVPIDYPGFNLPLAERAAELGTAVVYYIAPQVWAWKESRARRLARVCDEICVVLPFETDLLESYGASVRFVGHPLLDLPRRHQGTGSAIGVFPGSRSQEVRRMLPTFLAAARQVADGRIPVRVARARDLPSGCFEACPAEWLVSAEEALAASRVAITKSGTITLQLALADVPFVVGYRVNALTFRVLRRLVRVPHVSLVNLVAGRRVVRELIQGDMTADALGVEADRLMADGPARSEVLEGLADVRALLGEPGAAGRVADACAEVLQRRRSP